MTSQEYGQMQAFPGPVVPGGVTRRDWLYGMGFQGIMASGKQLGTNEITARLSPLVDAILEDLAKAHQSADR
jgi:hypothetical protein